jgi:hypothetical protein
MFFKRTYFLYLCCLALLLGSCKKWLAVSPATQVTENEQFSSLQGFTDALFGIYQKGAGDNIYGNSLSYGVLDILAQRYENKTSTTDYYGQLARYNYTYNAGTVFNVLPRVEAIWRDMYADVAQCNFILSNVEPHKSVLAGNAYNIVKGEALGMRGMLHFDLLRLYAPAFLGGINAAAKAIPYMEQFTVTPQNRLTVQQVLDKCETDLKAAETLLSVYPTIDQIALNQGSTSADLFLMYRQNHLNYWAVKAILARLYLYKGDKANALKYAQDVIASGLFRFATAANISVDQLALTSDLTFSAEHIFSIYKSNLKATADSLFKPAENQATDDKYDLYSTQAKLDLIYEASVPGYGTDVRTLAATKSLWNVITTTKIYSKKFYSDNAANVKQRLVPVVRLPEMFYIAAEASPTPEQGVVYLDSVRTMRQLPKLGTATAITLDAEILKEYRKELNGEGQLWFYYKRKNIVTIPDGVGNPMTEAKYLFPLPQNEIEFGKP